MSSLDSSFIFNFHGGGFITFGYRVKIVERNKNEIKIKQKTLGEKL